MHGALRRCTGAQPVPCKVKQVKQPGRAAACAPAPGGHACACWGASYQAQQGEPKQASGAISHPFQVEHHVPVAHPCTITIQCVEAHRVDIHPALQQVVGGRAAAAAFVPHIQQLHCVVAWCFLDPVVRRARWTEWPIQRWDQLPGLG